MSESDTEEDIIEAVDEKEDPFDLEYEGKSIASLDDGWGEAPAHVEEYLMNHTDCRIDSPFTDLYIKNDRVVYKDVYRRNHFYTIVRS